MAGITDFFNTTLNGIQSFGRGVGSFLGQNYDPNLATFDAYKKYLGFTTDQPLDAFQRLELDKAYNNALQRQTAQNQAALAPWALGLQGLGAVANWWGMNKGANLAEKSLKAQLAFQKANFDNTTQLVEDARKIRAQNRANWANTEYVPPVPLVRV